MLRILAVMVGLWAAMIPAGAWKFSPGEAGGQTIQLYGSPTAPLIAGLPSEEILAIARGHEEELKKVPGVDSVGVGVNGIAIGVFIHANERGEKPTSLPPEIQALPSKIANTTGFCGHKCKPPIEEAIKRFCSQLG